MEAERNSVHYGQEVKKRFEEHSMTVTEFARRICRSRNTVYSIFKREFINLQLLRKISDVLDFDFIRNL